MRWYAYLSGEHPTLPLAELRAILEAEAGEYRMLLVLDQAAIFDACVENPARITGRAGMVKELGRVAAVCEADAERLVDCLKGYRWPWVSEKGFAVRPRFVKGYSKEALPPEKAVRIVADWITRSTGMRVNLLDPGITARILVSEGVAIVGMVSSSRHGGLHGRRPRARPFFKPGALSPQLSRVFVNLSRIRGGEVFLDPFCGTGGFALEAALLGAYSVCGDIDRVMAWGSRLNLSWAGVRDKSEVYVGDACRLPLRALSIDAVGTDPPYGRSTSTRRRSVASVIAQFLQSVAEVLRRNRYVAFASPLIRGLEVEDMVEDSGLRLVEKHYMRVHRSLTRILAVAVRP
jgi:tRNA (guanine10-N2)-dimethyltransferase